VALVDDRTIRRSTAEGIMDIPAFLKAATHAEWLIVELDRCATDIAEAVTKSARYLKTIAYVNAREARR